MDKKSNKSYYALVWASQLESKKNSIIKGKLIHKKTKLPRDPGILYGTNSNDVARIRVVENFEEIKYDVSTMIQSVKFWSEVDEYVVPRDVRIIIWEGESELNLSFDQYKIVSPDVFELIVATTEENSFNEDDFISDNWDIYKNPIRDINDKVLNELNLNNYDNADNGEIKFTILKKSTNKIF